MPGSRNWALEKSQGELSIGVIGAGHVAKVYHLPILDALPNVTISFIADIDGSRANQLANSFESEGEKIEDAGSLPECDAVLLAIPVVSRGEYLAEFGEREVPIFCEKPFAIDLQTHRDYLNRADRILCNYMRTLYGTVQQVHEIIHSEIFGRPRRVEITEERLGASNKPPNHYQNDPERGGGILLETGVHSLSQLLYLFPDHDWVVESAKVHLSRGLDVDVQANIEFLGEAFDIPISYQLSMVNPIGTQVRVLFERVELRFDPADPGAPVTIRAVDRSMSPFSLAMSNDWPTTLHQAMFLRWKQFIHIANGGESDEITLISGKDVTDLIETIRSIGEA